MMMDIDAAYSVGAFIEGGAAFPERWADQAFEFRSTEQAVGRAQLNIAYGPGARDAFDLFLPSGRPQGLLVFVHGGYWMEFDRTDWSHFSQGATERDWAVAIPSYTLAPEARIAEITCQVARAIAAAARRIAGPIVLAGHSAGGHLVARMVCDDSPLPQDSSARISHVMPISPLGDLRPIARTAMNETLHLDTAEAINESPVLHAKCGRVPVSVWVGANERPAFLDQARNLSQAWGAGLTIAPERHHFDVIDDLQDPGSEMIQRLLRH